MGPIDITVLVIVVLILVAIVGTYIYKKIKGIPTGDCSCCAPKGNKLLKQYRKKYKKNPNKSCCCGCCMGSEESNDQCCCETHNENCSETPKENNKD